MIGGPPDLRGETCVVCGEVIGAGTALEYLADPANGYFVGEEWRSGPGLIAFHVRCEKDLDLRAAMLALAARRSPSVPHEGESVTSEGEVFD